MVELTAESTTRYIETSKFRIRLHDVGSGPVLVLLHGSGPGATGWSNFRLNIGPLSESHRVLAIDMPGWGESDTQTAATGRDHAATLVEILDVLGIDRVALVGNSMGGMTSIEVAIRFPERVTHLITMGAPSPGKNIFAPGDGLSEGAKILNDTYHDPTPEAMKRLVQVMCYDKSMATDDLAELRAAAARSHPEHLASYLDWPLPAPFYSLGDRLGEITAPTLLIHGRDDRVLPYENSLRLLASIPDSRLLLVNRCGHWVQVEHPEEFNRVVTSFVGA